MSNFKLSNSELANAVQSSGGIMDLRVSASKAFQTGGHVVLVDQETTINSAKAVEALLFKTFEEQNNNPEVPDDVKERMRELFKDKK